MASRGERTKQAMLEAGVDLTREASVQDYLAFLRPDDVAAAAGRSKSTFFHHWPSMSAYVDDLVAMAVSPLGHQPLAAIFGRRADPLESYPEALRRFRSLATGAFEAFVSNRTFPFYVLAVVAGDEAAQAELGRANRELDARIGEVVDQYLVSQGQRIRDPFTADIMVATIYAVGVGLAMRAQSDGDRITGILFADVLAGLLPALVTSAGDRLALDDYVDLALLRQRAATDASPSLVMPGDIVAAAAEATQELRAHVTPAAEALLVETAAEQKSWNLDAAIAYLAGLHDLFADHAQACLLATVVVHASRIVPTSPEVADPLRDSGLDGITHRALRIGPDSPHLGELVRNTELRLMRVVYGGDPTPLDRCLREIRAVLELDA